MRAPSRRKCPGKDGNGPRASHRGEPSALHRNTAMQDTKTLSQARFSAAELLELLDYSGLEDRVRDLERERDAYRELVISAIHTLHALVGEKDAQQRTIAAQRQTIRDLRE